MPSKSAFSTSLRFHPTGVQPIRTGQRLSVAGGGRGSDPRVLEVVQLAASLASFGLDAVNHRVYEK